MLFERTGPGGSTATEGISREIEARIQEGGRTDIGRC